MKPFDVVTCGEPMVLFSPSSTGPLRYVTQFNKYAAGAELNFSVGLARLGLQSGLITKVGEDEFGQYILACMRAEGLETALVKEDPAHPTGVYFKEYSGLGDPKVYYYRRGSAAGTLSPEDIDPGCLDGVQLVHLSGITPALSQSCRETCLTLLSLAEKAGIKVSFDPNIRLGRLHDAETVRAFMDPFIAKAHVLILNRPECELLFGSGELAQVMEEVFALGAEVVVLKQGAGGSAAAERCVGVIYSAESFKAARYVDPVGAGDGFDAGFVYGYLQGWPIQKCLRLANFVGASATTVLGDYEGYPFLPDALRAVGSGQG